MVKYSPWDDITYKDLGIPVSVEFTPDFLSRMRISYIGLWICGSVGEEKSIKSSILNPAAVAVIGVGLVVLENSLYTYCAWMRLRFVQSDEWMEECVLFPVKRVVQVLKELDRKRKGYIKDEYCRSNKDSSFMYVSGGGQDKAHSLLRNSCAGY
ncbi:UNVERIFIED_CONTAM: hypothetical protein PYX00_000893 [Menopon gallinae]|uniref:Uncharacterized protein n=1 Tax=Menopon gallinae TaxID=328185 RepID=A0AAW2IAS7_9NEOP